MKKILQRMIGVDIDAWEKTGQLVEAKRIRSRAGFIRDAHMKYLQDYLVYDSLCPEEKIVILAKELEELLERLRRVTLPCTKVGWGDPEIPRIEIVTSN